MKVKTELIVQHGKTFYWPVIEEGITWSTERKGAPGELSFKVVVDDKLNITEGNGVIFKVNGVDVFYGFIFKLKRNKDHIITVTAYDQLRYLKNKDTYVYEGITAGQLIKRIADDYQLQTGELEDTGYIIPSRIEDNSTLFDTIQTALDLTLQNKGKIYVMYDDFGKIMLKSLENMKVGDYKQGFLMIDQTTAQNFDYTSTIDTQTYNKVKLTYDNDQTGQREIYIAQSGDNMNKWGVLQYFDTLDKDENGQAKADALLSLYNSKTRNLTVKEAAGDLRVRGGSLVIISLKSKDIKYNQFMLVEKAKHTFKSGEHTMTLTLRGGDVVA